MLNWKSIPQSTAYQANSEQGKWMVGPNIAQRFEIRFQKAFPKHFNVFSVMAQIQRLEDKGEKYSPEWWNLSNMVFPSNVGWARDENMGKEFVESLQDTKFEADFREVLLFNGFEKLYAAHHPRSGDYVRYLQKFEHIGYLSMIVFEHDVCIEFDALRSQAYNKIVALEFGSIQADKKITAEWFPYANYRANIARFVCTHLIPMIQANRKISV